VEVETKKTNQLNI